MLFECGSTDLIRQFYCFCCHTKAMVGEFADLCGRIGALDSRGMRPLRCDVGQLLVAFRDFARRGIALLRWVCCVSLADEKSRGETWIGTDVIFSLQ